MCSTGDEKGGMEAINKLKSTDPPLFLSPNTDLSVSSRIASQYLFASLKPYTPKSPFDQLLTDGFDAEQIWQQIDLQSQPLISSLKREIRRFEKNPNQISSLFAKSEANGGLEREINENGSVGLEGDSDELEELSDDDEGEEGEGNEDEADEEMGMGEEDGEEEEEEGDEDESGDDISDGEGVPEVEDEFLKIKDLEKYLAREEEKEYGSEEKKNEKKGKNGSKAPMEDDDEEDMDDEEDDEEADEVDDELLLYGEDDEDEDGSGATIRYEDFFVPDKKMPERKRKQVDESDGSETDDENDKHKNENLSTYEKERQKLEAKIKEMEEVNLASKDWTMQGEVTATRRPKDSALEVDLEFEHNLRPPPVITEEVTASLEEIIKKRILELNFDDVQKAPKLPSAAPKQIQELDDNKSKKGLAEVYEEEYAKQTGLASAPVSFNDELKTEVMEDMAIQANVPALAMEEIAPVAVSDAAMLAPEEVFAGKGDIKEETELTKEDRKRRRAKKKRRFKAIKAKRTAERASEKPLQTPGEGKPMVYCAIRKVRYYGFRIGLPQSTDAKYAAVQWSYCGNLTIDYPFGLRYGCGHPGYRDLLYCINDVLMLHISSGSYRVLDIDYGFQALTLHDPHLSTCDSIVLGSKGNGFVVEPWRAPYLTPTPENAFLLIGCSAKSLLFQGFPSKHIPCRNVSGLGCEEYYTCPAWGFIEPTQVGLVYGSGPPECCAVGFEELGPAQGINLTKLECEGYSSAYSLAPLRGDGPHEWSYGIRVKYSVQVHDAFCKACEATGGTCGYSGDHHNGITELCFCGTWNSTSNCDTVSGK
ncbi:hypothetical protein Cgig2_012736 [Carnegiea gigantea]|uniref:Wall-associated receptor kinase galacturonan-binding domain-containing protein n=1 Tax=Carnegiea gigantea TaxID=171969 RepID=A0A9Q1KB96_9CARY|nr:hypothetical protein Cgig2_012736 [Carnegiea gigantea]